MLLYEGGQLKAYRTKFFFTIDIVINRPNGTHTHTLVILTYMKECATGV